MTEYVDGKKYRVTRDYGVMTYNAENEVFQQPDGKLWVADSIVTGEPIPDPLPTTPGSVIDVDWALERYQTYRRAQCR